MFFWGAGGNRAFHTMVFRRQRARGKVTRAAGRGRSSWAVSFTLSTASYCCLSFRRKYLLFLLRLFISACITRPFWFWVFFAGFSVERCSYFSKQKLVLESYFGGRCSAFCSQLWFLGTVDK